MIINALFQVYDKNIKFYFLKKTFILANIIIDFIFQMFFLIWSKVKVNFNYQKLKYRLYTAAHNSFTIKQLKLIGKKELITATIEPEYKIFIAYLTSIIISNQIYFFYRVQIALFKVNKITIIVLLEYSNFAGIFSLKLIAKLLKYIESDNLSIKLIYCKQPVYGSINYLWLVELKILKIYIQTSLANNFIRSF